MFVAVVRWLVDDQDSLKLDISQYSRFKMLRRLSMISPTMNRLDSRTRAQVINCLTEGCSIRATVRMTGVAKKTVIRLFG
jgi:hypothetical protein